MRSINEIQKEQLAMTKKTSPKLISPGDFILKCPNCKRAIFGRFFAIGIKQQKLFSDKKYQSFSDNDTLDLSCECGVAFHGWIYRK